MNQFRPHLHVNEMFAVSCPISGPFFINTCKWGQGKKRVEGGGSSGMPSGQRLISNASAVFRNLSQSNASDRRLPMRNNPKKKKQQANRNSKPNCCGVGRNLNQFRFLLSVKCISCSLVSKFCSSWPEVHPLFNSQIYLHFLKKKKKKHPPPHYAAHPPSRNEFEWMK